MIMNHFKYFNNNFFIIFFSSCGKEKKKFLQNKRNKTRFRNYNCL